MAGSFYETLPESRGLAALLASGVMTPAPEDAWLACADVRGSTQAIRDGRYKDVNLAGAACITAVLNATGHRDLPFVFGGDGAMLLVDADCRELARAALAGTVVMAKTALNLEMRAGLVSVSALRKVGAEVLVGRVRMSEGFHQAAFAGGGAVLAEEWLKAGDARVDHIVPAAGQAEADFAGLECRWTGVKPERGRVASLIVESRQGRADGLDHLREVLTRIETMLGHTAMRRPVTADTLGLACKSEELLGEARVQSGSATPAWWHRLKVKLETETGRFIMKHAVKWRDLDWGRYRADAADNTDFEKLDDALRMVVAADEDALSALRTYLETEAKAGRIWYGLADSEECRITCLVLVRGREHFHFVDGAGGGYAMAAASLKQAKATHKKTLE